MRMAGFVAGLGLMVAGFGMTQAEEQDPYLWLEDVSGAKPMEWVEAHNKATLDVLTAHPLYAQYLADASQILKASDRIPYPMMIDGVKGIVHNFWQDAEHKQGLWRRATLASYKTATPEWETVIDFDALSKAENETWVFKGADCIGPEYRICAVTLSRGGSDAAEVREFDLSTKQFVSGGYFLKEAKSGTSWTNADAMMVATDFGAGSLTTSGYPRVAKLWRRGTPLADAKTVFEGKAEDVGIWPGTFESEDGRVTIVTRAVTFFESEYFLIDDAGAAKQIPLPVTADVKTYFKGHLIALMRADWEVDVAGAKQTIPQGALIAFPLKSWSETGQVARIDVLETPGPREAVDAAAAGRDALYVTMLDNVRGRLHAHAFDAATGTWTRREVAAPDNGTVSVAALDDYSPLLMVNFENFLTPDQLSLSMDGVAPLETIKTLPARFDASGRVITQYEATSRDGTKVPYFVVAPEAQGEPLPALLYAYGGFEVSMNPWYSAGNGKLWMEQGGVFAVANIRGGGEFGPGWHEQALGVNRQRAYDDFIAVAEDMIARGITTAKQLGINGGSNGGLLVGVAFTQRPDLFGAVLCDVPLLDMIRYTQLPPGASWIAEYGDPADPTMRDAILKYSPYQNLKAETAYPRVFFLTSTKDDRVNPAHARKMAAAMEGMGKPFYYYEETEGGHSAAANLDQRAKQLALQYIYLRKQLMEGGN